jgi:hypothetical protein
MAHGRTYCGRIKNRVIFACGERRKAEGDWQAKPGTWNMKLRTSTFINQILLLLFLTFFLSDAFSQGTKLFQPVPPQKSGITFKNTITENEEANALTHENLYNGGGVATGEINNDGLEVADFNNDTWPDLVICGEFMPLRVFINEKGKKFTEAAKSYITQADGGFWNRLFLADFDRDGDMYLIAGNQNAACVRLGVIDASYGQLFKGDGKGNFRYIPQSLSGFTMTGDVKSLKTITVRNSRYLLGGISNLGIVTYKLNSK